MTVVLCALNVYTPVCVFLPGDTVNGVDKVTTSTVYTGTVCCGLVSSLFDSSSEHLH